MKIIINNYKYKAARGNSDTTNPFRIVILRKKVLII